MANLRELRAERGQSIADARAIVDAADAQKRALNADEQVSYDKAMDRALELRGSIERIERLQDEERALGERNENEDRAKHGKDEPTAMDGFRSWIVSGNVAAPGSAEFRALSASTSTEGGYLVAPEQFVASLIKNIDDQVFMRQMATTYSLTSSASLGVPTLTANPADFDWTTELQTGSEDSTMAFGKRRMEPHPVAKRIKVSSTLLRTASLPAEQIITDRMAYVYAITMEQAYLTGNGNQRPLGVFTASANGVPTSRDVSTDNTTTTITADGLINAKYSLKGQYQARASWLFHRDAIKMIAKLKDGDGQYLWKGSMREGEPDTLLGRPVMMSEFAPNTFTSQQYVGMFADFSHYWIVDSLQMQMQRLVELYAESNQVGFIARYEGDGAPVLAEAFARVKLA